MSISSLFTKKNSYIDEVDGEVFRFFLFTDEPECDRYYELDIGRASLHYPFMFLALPIETNDNG